jgi:K+/H+ antiporter YhaU regulatory subunit KhtT
MPQPQLTLQAGDLLVIGGRPQDIEVLKGLDTLQVDRRVDVNLEKLEEGSVQIVEVMLSPYTELAGKTLGELQFREKVRRVGAGDLARRPRLPHKPWRYSTQLRRRPALLWSAG